MLPQDPRWGRCQGPLTCPFAVSSVEAVVNQPNWLGLLVVQSPAMFGRHQPVSSSALQFW